MKRLFFILSTLSLLSCQENETIEKRVDQETVHPDWTKLEIPGGRQALAIAGSIDDTLLVTTWTKAYYTADQGETWQESINFHGPIPGLYVHQDTILSLEAYLYEDAESPPKAALAQYYTVDFGKSWHYYPGDIHAYKQLIGVVASSSGTTYQIKHRRTPISEGASSYWINPSDIVIDNGFGEESIDFPFQRELINLYMDSQDRLYVAASGGVHIEEDNTIFCCTNDTPAIVYISRYPLPQ